MQRKEKVRKKEIKMLKRREDVEGDEEERKLEER